MHELMAKKCNPCTQDLTDQDVAKFLKELQTGWKPTAEPVEVILRESANSSRESEVDELEPEATVPVNPVGISEGRIAMYLYLAACLIVSFVGNLGIAGFVGIVIMGFYPAFLLFCFWGLFESGSAARFFIGVAIGLLFSFVVIRIEEGVKREGTRRLEAAESARKYRDWYNRLPPHQKLEIDNERLREKNAELQSLLNSNSR